MATRYVENYRFDDMNDTQTIQAAINALKDGDTLVFNKTYDRDPITDKDVPSTTYVLDEPVDFTKCNVGDDETPEIINKTKRCLTIDGGGCTIKNSANFTGYTDTYIKSDGSAVAYNIEALFIVSDMYDMYMENCHLKNFNFEATALNGRSYSYPEGDVKDYPVRYLVSIAPGPSNPDIGVLSTYHYMVNCKITNCRFKYFLQGIELGGENNTIENCKFENCTTGIFCDCPNQAYITHNYFFCTEWSGISLTKACRSFVNNNYFYHCINYFIRGAGTFDKEKDTDIISVSICSNTFEGGKVNGFTRNQNGIFFSGVKNAIIKGNFIYNMKYLSSAILTDETNNPGIKDKNNYFGTGIWLDGTIDNPDLDDRFCQKCIIANNIISGCSRYGLKVDHSLMCTINNNCFSSAEENSDDDLGIYVGNNAGDIHISNNTVSYYKTDNFINSNIYNIILHNNVYCDKNKKFDPEYPARFIDNTSVSNESTSTICIPDLSVPLVNGEEFEMLIPEGFTSSVVTTVSYNGLFGNIYNKSGSSYQLYSSMIGNYIRLKYSYSQSAHSGQKYISFTVIEKDD